jgi:hypothetical protein
MNIVPCGGEGGLLAVYYGIVHVVCYSYAWVFENVCGECGFSAYIGKVGPFLA